MVNNTDLTAVLPDGRTFEFWEVPQEYDREIHVNNNHPDASDDNDGTIDRPLKTINAAAQMGTNSVAISTPRSPLATMIPSATSRISLRLS